MPRSQVRSTLVVPRPRRRRRPANSRSRDGGGPRRPTSPGSGAVALVAQAPVGETGAMRPNRYPRPCPAPRSAFNGYRFPSEVITLAVRWYLRFGLSYRDVAELLAERGIQVDHVTIYRWVRRFTPLLAEAARPCRHA